VESATSSWLPQEGAEGTAQSSNLFEVDKKDFVELDPSLGLMRLSWSVNSRCSANSIYSQEGLV
jgi:hypothetical protein